MKFSTIKNDLSKQEHLLLYDDVTEFVRRAKNATAHKHVRDQIRLDQDWLGRDFDDNTEAFEALYKPWKEGLDLVEKLRGKVEHMALPSPRSRRRRTSWNEQDGDDVCLDRMRNGQEYWQQRRRVRSTGPTEFAIVVNVVTCSGSDPETTFFRGAAAIALCDMLERAGYRTELFAMMRCSNIWREQKHDRWTFGSLGVPLKLASQPADMSLTANLLSGWAFRTSWFANMADYHDDLTTPETKVEATACGLGQCQHSNDKTLRALTDRHSSATGMILFDWNISTELLAIETLTKAIESIGIAEDE